MSFLPKKPDRTISTHAESSLRNILAGLTGKAWFPQVPISLGVVLLGLLHLIPILEQAIALHLHLRTPGAVREDQSWTAKE